MNPVSKKPPPTGPRSLVDLLQSGDIGKLLAEAAERRRILAEVRAALPGEEAEHVVSAGTDGAGKLVVGVDSGAWAARVRYLVSKLGRDVHVRVVPKGGGPRRD